jgi:hypothetical protein
MATILTDDFNSYTDGDIVGQGDWVKYDHTGKMYVQDSVVKEGAKALGSYVTGDNIAMIEKTGTARTDGQLVYYVRLTNTNMTAMLWAKENTSSRFGCYFANDGKIKYYTGSFTEIQSSYNANQWYEVKIEWRSSDHKVRYSIDGEVKTDWVSPNSAWTTGVNKIYIQANYASDESVYFDHIAEEPYTGTNMQINIGDTWKEVTKAQINIGDTWKAVESVKINIGDDWKTVF